MIYAKSDSFFTVWRGTIHDKYAEFSLSTSRKDRRTDEYKNSNWNYVRFVGDAFEQCKKLKERDRITGVTFALECEPYKDKTGETVYPKSPRITIFSFEMADDVPQTKKRAPTKPTSKPYAAVDDVSNDDYMDTSDDMLPF